MPVYRYDPETGRTVDKATGAPMVTTEGLAAPRVWSDLPMYRSPVTGEPIEGRKARREDMLRHNCVDANDLPSPKGLRNEAFAAKHGLTHLLNR